MQHMSKLFAGPTEATGELRGQHMGETEKGGGGRAGQAADRHEQRGAVPRGGRSLRTQDGGQTLRQVRSTIGQIHDRSRSMICQIYHRSALR